MADRKYAAIDLDNFGVPSAANDDEPSITRPSHTDRANNEYSGLGSHLSLSSHSPHNGTGHHNFSAASIIRRVTGGERTGPHYLHSVPDDAIYTIMSYLDIRGVVAVSRIDLRMRELLHSCDDVWRLKAVTDYTHLTLEERRAAAHWAVPREKYVFIRQRRHQVRANAGFERLRQADLDAGEREALTRRLPFHYFAESGFTVLVPSILFLFAFLLSRSESISVYMLVFPLILLQALVFGLLFMLWGLESHSYEADWGLVSLGLTHFFTDSPPVARKYSLAACMNGCAMLFTALVAMRVSDERAAGTWDVVTKEASFAWGATFGPVWVLASLLALPLAWNERSTINWRALWLLVIVPHLLGVILLVVSLDGHRYIPLGQCMIPVFVSHAFAGFVLIRVALRFGCHVVWRGWHCVLVADPWSNEFGPDRDVLDAVARQNDHDAADWRSSSIASEAGQDTTARCTLCSGAGATAVAAVAAFATFIVFEIMLCAREAAVHAHQLDAASTLPIPSMKQVCTPLLLSCALLICMSVRYARQQHEHRTSTYAYQMERPELTAAGQARRG